MNQDISSVIGNAFIVCVCIYIYIYLYIYIYVCVCVCVILQFFSGSAAQRGLWPPRPRGFRDHTQRRTTVGRTPLDE
jgi:hypothetical protein